MEKPKILVVEDEGIIAFHVKKLLDNYGYEVTGIAVAAEEAIKLAESTSPDLILMDITLKSEKDGVYAAEVIKKDYNIPIIFLTANTDESTLHRAKIVEPYGFINKPFQGRELKTNIEIALHTHKMRKQLFESEQLLYATLSSINEGVISYDKNNIIKFVNIKACELTGFLQDEMIGKNIKEIYVIVEDTSDETFICNLSGIIAGKEQHNFFNNKLLIRKDHTQIPVEEDCTPIRDFNNKLSGNVLVFRDITKQRQAQLDLLRSRNYYLSLFDSIPALIWQTNKTNEFNYFNKSWLDYRSKGIEEEVGAKWIADIHSDERDSFINKITQVIERRETFYNEFRLRNQNGDYNWLICIASPYNDMKGEFAGYLGVCQDITNLKKIEQALLESKIKAENAVEAKSRFISVMSHELRTPMNGILGMIELLKESNINSEQKNYIRILSQGAYTLLNTINSILDLSKSDAGKNKLEETEFNIESLISDIIESYYVLTDIKNVELKFSSEKDIPELLLGDAGKLKQILTNILNNAVKFTNSGKISINLSQSRTEVGANNYTNLLITVSDTGIGIPSDKIEVIFESFKQADDSHTREYGGVGLGLSISKQLTELLGGQIWVESEINKGSKFYISLQFKTVSENVTI